MSDDASEAAASAIDANFAESPDEISLSGILPDETSETHPDVSSSYPVVFVGNLSLYTDQESLRRHFEQFGRVSDVRVMYHSNSHKNKRFGFVSFFESSSCELALKQKSHFLHGKMLHVKQAFRPFSTGKRGSQTQDGEETEEDLSRRVFVGGVSQRLCRRDLLEFFSGFGEVLDLVLLSDQKTGRHKGFAFLTFAKKEVAARVCAQRYHALGQSHMEVKKAKAKPKRTPETQTNPLLAVNCESPNVENKVAVTASAAATTAAALNAIQHQLLFPVCWQQPAVISAPPLRYSPYAVPGRPPSGGPLLSVQQAEGGTEAAEAAVSNPLQPLTSVRLMYPPNWQNLVVALQQPQFGPMFAPIYFNSLAQK